MDPVSEPRAPLAGIDYAVALVTVVLALPLLAFPVYATPYRELLADFGGGLPFIVRAALTWLGPVIALSLVGAVGGALAGGTVFTRRLVAGLAIVVGSIALFGCGFATVWPFWAMADRIQTDPAVNAGTAPVLPATAASFPLFRSRDGGRAWERAGTGLPEALRIDALAEVDNVWIAGTERGVFVSRDDGASFARPERGVPEDTKVFALFDHRGEAFAATKRGLYRADRTGRTWTAVDELQKLSTWSIASMGERLAVGTDGEGVWLRDESAHRFRRVDDGLPPRAQIFALAVRDGVLHAGLYARGVYRLELAANRWLPAGDETPMCLVERGGVLFSGRNPGGVFTSASDGAPWVDQSVGLPPNAPIWMLAATPRAVFAGTRGTVGLFRLEDEPNAFVPSDGGLPPGADAIALGAGKRSLLTVVIVSP